MTGLIHETRDRIAFAAEGVALGAGELLDVARDRARLILALLTLGAVAAFVLTQEPGGEATASSSAAESAAPAVTSTGTFVEESGFSLSLPAAWERIETPDGAAFSATSADGMAETTLWVERNRDLSFDGFVTQSLGGLETLGAEAKITDRVDGPTIETSTAELRAEIPRDGMAPGPYRVDLRAAGPYRYYLATSIEPGAPAGLLADAALLGSSLRPEVTLRGVHPTG